MAVRIILASASPRRQELLRQVGLEPEVIPSHVDENGVDGSPEQIVTELSRRKAEDVAGELSRRKAEDVTGELSRRKTENVAGELSQRKAEDVAGELSRRKAENVAEGLSERKSENAGMKLLRQEAESDRAEPAVIIGADTVVAVDSRILGKPGSKEDAEAMIGLLAGRAHHVYTGVTMIFLPSGERVTFAEDTEVEVYPMTQEQIRRYVATGEPMDKAGAYGIQGYFAAYVKGIRGDYNNVVGLPVARVCRELAARKLF